MLTQLLNHVSKEQCPREEYTKKRGPGRRKFIDGGLFGALNRAGAWTGQGQGLKKRIPRQGPLTGVGRGIEVGAHWFRGPRGPVMNTNHTQTSAENTILNAVARGRFRSKIDHSDA